ncbi:MAG: DUF2141 domain-containing protein [Bacteroidia bacterium]|nr:DUF2141 domain-containing protein [Bacteroidia bacterium]
MRKIVLLFCLLLAAFSAQAITQKITIHVAGIKEAKGNILIGVYDDPKNFAKVGRQIKLISVPADSETIKVTITDLKEGEYAFTVLHDKNANGKCDYNLLGIPKESIAFSNNVKPKLKVPSFNDVKVDVTDGMILRIKLLSF